MRRAAVVGYKMDPAAATDAEFNAMWNHLVFGGRGVPRLASPEVGRTILERLQRLSQRFGTRIAIEQGLGVIRLEAGASSELRR